MHLKLKEGAYHKATGTPAGEPIPKSTIKKDIHSTNEHKRKMAQFAENASHWHHGKK